MIPYGRQDINQADVDAVIDVLNSDFLTQGSQVPLFENTVSKYCGSNHSVAVNSATSALHIACLASYVIHQNSKNLLLYLRKTLLYLQIEQPYPLQ